MEIEEAAMIDGCNPIQIFFKVVFPILKPTMISTAILETMWVWNDYLLPTLVLDIKKYRTIPMAIQYFRGGYGRVELAPMMACIIIAIIPIIILYMTCQKYIIEGVVQVLSRAKEVRTMRASGILMPVFSLPGPFGIGTLGKEAFAFVDFLAEAKQTYWQILPIGPTGYGDSPYQSFSAFAGNPYFIDYRLLADVGLLTVDEVPAARPVGPIDYGALYNERPVILKKAADRLLAAPLPPPMKPSARRRASGGGLRPVHGCQSRTGQAGLADWPDDLRCRKPEAIAAAKQRLADAVDYYKAVQFFFYTQWNALKLTPTARASVWWAIFPSMSARIPAICGPTRSCSRPTEKCI